MPKSPFGKYGDIDVEGTPMGMVSPIQETSVDAQAPGNTVIFDNIIANRRYRVETVCPNDDCWQPVGWLPVCGANGLDEYVIPQGSVFEYLRLGSFAIKLPGSSLWIPTGKNIFLFNASESGPLLGSMAQWDIFWDEGSGSMDVVVQELGDDGSPMGELDELETFTGTGSGGTIPAEGDLVRNIGISTFEIIVRRDGVVNLINNVKLTGLSHTYANDLKISLVSPRGTRVVMANRFDVSADYDGDYTFTDDAPYALREDEDTNKIITGESRTSESFSKLVGDYISGVWILEIRDYQHDDTGSLTSWSIDFSVATTDHEIYASPGDLQGRQEIVHDFYPSGYLSIPPYIEGGGTWPTVMPVDPTIYPIIVNTVGELKELLFIEMWFQHYLSGDVHAVLTSPSGTKVTVFHRPGSTSGSTGNTSGFTYPSETCAGFRFVESGSPLLPVSGSISAGTYSRDPGDWPGIPNDKNIPIGSFDDFIGEDITGTWYLTIYDWNDNSQTGWIDKVWLSLKYYV